MKILLTGTPGSGKTTFAQYARGLGDTRFFDTDDIIGLCEWRDMATGKSMGSVTEFAEDGTDAWYKTYGWYWRPERLKEFLVEHDDVVVCGSAENAVELYNHFDSIAILIKEKSDLISNLNNPNRNNPFGKTTVQRANFMNWQDHLIEGAKDLDHFHIEGNNTAAAYQKLITHYFKS